MVNHLLKKTLKDFEIYLEGINVPNSLAIQTLKKVIKAFPDSPELQEKLKEIENSNSADSFPKAMCGVFLIAIGFMGLGLLQSRVTDLINNFDRILGLLFVFGACIIFKQYCKEK